MTSNSPVIPISDPETYRSYYLLQYERVAQHESQRLQFTNYVVAGSVIALGIIASQAANSPFTVRCVLGVVVFANLLAIANAHNSRQWIKLHQARAKKALVRFAPDVFALQEQVSKPNSDRNPFRGELLVRYLHGGIAILCLILVWYA